MLNIASLSLGGVWPKSLDVSFGAADVPLRIPAVLLLSVNVDECRVISNLEETTPLEDRLELTGGLKLYIERYIKRWSLVINNLRPHRIAEAEPAILGKSPLLSNARLGLTIVSPAFLVRNNIADTQPTH